jgi:hypothetical protein
LAAQSVDQERNKLATLFGQVSYLLRQYGRSVNLLAQNPALSDSFLLSRNHSIQQADDAFLLAQQWAFLTAQCFYYEDNCLADLSSKTYLQNILAARNVATLVANLNAITSSNAVLGATCQGSISYGYKDISLRNNVIQQNSVSNGVVTIYEPTILSGVVGTNAAASTASWTNFLSQNISTSLGFRRLRVHFSTSVNPQIQNGLPRNPLFNPFTFGAVISPSSAPGGTCNGIQVNFVTSNLQLAPGGVSVLLAQGGTSLIRSLGYCNPNNSFRCFNFDPFQNSFTASFNGFDPSLPGSSAFKDRSIANDLWALTLVDDGGNGTTILNNLDKLVDIQLRFGMRNYTDQNCGI